MSLDHPELSAVISKIGNPQDDFRVFDNSNQFANTNRRDCNIAPTEEDEIDSYEENDETSSLLVSSNAPTATSSKGFTNQQTCRNDLANTSRPGITMQSFEIDDRKDDGCVRNIATVCNDETKNECTEDTNLTAGAIPSRFICTLIVRCCYFHRNFKSTLKCMNHMAKLVLWATAVALIVAVIWYSYELHNHGTDPHLIAWFSAGAFVLLGFPVSMWGIVGHLSNYNQPNVQVYVVRILWMVPLYSFESWLAMRFHKRAIYIETLRDFYESYVLYSFLQFLIEVLGGEENLIQMLKDKSPTRGVHMWGLQYCARPWLMGQPLRRTNPFNSSLGSTQTISPIIASRMEHKMLTMEESSDEGIIPLSRHSILNLPGTTVLSVGAGDTTNRVNEADTRRKGKSSRGKKQNKPTVIWTSPFFLNCKFGVLQYVLLKLFSAVAVLVLEWKGCYREGHFDWQSGYLYVCLITNMSQCWALYSLIFFYYATKTELSPIRPVGKFLSVKALVFFTWWQSVFISVMYQMDMIPTYRKDWTSEDVAKGIQDYLICVEMFAAAVVHAFVFPHTEYSQAAVEARLRAVSSTRSAIYYANERTGRKRLGRNRIHGQYYYTKFWKENYLDDGDGTSKNSNSYADLNFTADESTASEIVNETPTHQGTTRSSSSRFRSRDMLYGQHIQTQRGDPQYIFEAETDKISNHPISSKPASSHASGSVLPIFATAEGYQTKPSRNVEEESNLDKIRKPPAVVSTSYKDCSEGCGVNGSEVSEYHNVDEEEDDNSDRILDQVLSTETTRPGFVRAFLDSAIPRDLGHNTVAIVTGEYHVAKKTLLHHATTSDQYDLFSNRRRLTKQPHESTNSSKSSKYIAFDRS